ncbi:MAG: cyclic nucleotide-binding domain-containing protein, partial [Nannocystaceae bacterium]|nr:cyclic nucleotide-binding domain-containing protein [Nannocystaceae bacterium]
MRAEPFDAAPLRGLDSVSRDRLEAAGTTTVLRDGAALYEAGEDADDLYVVLRGRVRVAAATGVLRLAEPGHTLGEESMLGLPRRASATADGETEVFAVAAALLHRAWTRAGGRPVAAAERRRLERAVVADLLRGILPDLDGGALELLLDGASLRTIAADSYAARAGDPAAAAAVILDGVLHVRGEGTRVVERVALSPDALGVGEALVGRPWARDVVAAGPCQVVWVRADALRSALGAGAASLEAQTLQRARARATMLLEMQAGPTPEPVDVHRLARARSLLVIDQESCVRCGQCTRSCASNHADGRARMTRQGPRLVARVGSPATPSAPWLLAQACQHCSSPACLPDCPTAAITRDRDGSVQIDPALCTGCGACAKACPWDAIELGARPAGTPSPPGGPFESVAVKCDLCVGSSGGPACVQSCPTQALMRVDAGTAMVEAAAVLGRPVPMFAVKARVWPWLTSAGIGLSLGLGAWGAAQHDVGWIAGAGPGLRMGWLAAAALLGSLAYAGLRRRRWPLGRGAHGLGLHGILGALAWGAAWAHGGGRFAGSPGVLAGVLLLAVALGLFGLVAYQALPSRLTRLEAMAPMDEGDGAAPDPADALMRAVGGRSDALKRLTAAVLLPYVRRPGGGLRLFLSGRSLLQEQRRLRTWLGLQLGPQRLG